MHYRFRDFSFEAPDGRDDTTILIVDPAEPPAWNCTVRAQAFAGGAAGFPAWVGAQRSASGAVVDKKGERKIAEREAFVIEAHLVADGKTMRQQQAFILADVRVIVVTMTAKEQASAAARAAFDKLVASWSFT